MTSVLPYIKNLYKQEISEPLHQKQLFALDCTQRIGKQYVSIIVSAHLIQSSTYASNRDVTSAYKKFEDEIVKKMKTTKKQAYRIFGKYCLEQLRLNKEQKSLQIQLARIFFKELKIVSKSKAEPMFSFRKPFNKQERYQETQQTASVKTLSPTNKMYSELIKRIVPTPTLITKRQQIKVPQKLTQEQILDRTKSSISLNSLSTSINEINRKSYANPSKSQFIDDDNFSFQLTQKDLQKKSKQFSCQDYFIDVVAYLLKLNSPQGQLTYIWQHLKWGGFETYYQPYMNQALQWTCTAKISFPQNMYGKKQMFRTQRSKNKKKARQMACMDLLKSLYLQYPQVWMLYKHLKEQKRLVIAAVDQPKDQEEIALIKNRDKYTINKENVQKLFKHNKTDIRQKMEKISAKAELNTLLQQLPGRVTSPKLQKKPIQGNWLVPVRIEYKTYNDIQNNKGPKIYEKTIIFPNTKIAEQEAYMEAIIEMYQENPDLFQKIQSIKLAKGIKQPEKKLPLMRTLKDQQK